MSQVAIDRPTPLLLVLVLTEKLGSGRIFSTIIVEWEIRIFQEFPKYLDSV